MNFMSVLALENNSQRFAVRDLQSEIYNDIGKSCIRNIQFVHRMHFIHCVIGPAKICLHCRVVCLSLPAYIHCHGNLTSHSSRNQVV